MSVAEGGWEHTATLAQVRGGSTGRLRVVYRSYGGDNLKNRPAYYSKTTSLLSFLRALDQVEADVVFMNNGPVPEERLALMRGRGEIVSIGPTNMQGSWMTMLELAATWGDDLVWLAEDDYLYTEQSLAALVEAGRALPDVDYFALYGVTENSWYLPPGLDQPRPRGWTDREEWVGGRRWQRIDSTASTFAVRADALAKDVGIFRLAMVPHRSMYRDHDMFHNVQGYETHRWSDLGRTLLLRGEGSIFRKLRRVYLAPFLAASNLRSHRRPENRRTLMAVDLNLVAHMEVELLPPNHDWAAEAASVLAWAEQRHLVTT
jgi:hypothetical protein